MTNTDAKTSFRVGYWSHDVKSDGLVIGKALRTETGKLIVCLDEGTSVEVCMELLPVSTAPDELPCGTT